MKKRFVFGCLASAMILLSAQGAVAQTQAQTPAQVLSQYPNGGDAMESQIQTLMNANRANLAAIIEFAKTATQDQRKSIARGLATVAKAYAASDPGYTTQIAQSVANAGLPEFEKAYAEAASDTGTAAGGGGGGGGGPTANGPPQGGQNGGTTVEGNVFAVTQSSGLLSGSPLGGTSTTSVTPQ